MARILIPPAPLVTHPGIPTIFLAGSIEMGQASDWQTQFIQAFATDDVLILNPRRDEWDASWEQSISNPNFRAQVQWELDGQEAADVIGMYFDPQTKAPITLMELGLFARTGKVVVCCPSGYWRRGNVEVVCDRFGIPLTNNFNQLIEAVRDRLKNL